MYDHRIIVAIDCSNRAIATELIIRGTRPGNIVKVGLELFTATGPDIIPHIKTTLKRGVFLDLKFHDTPDTIGKATKNAAKLGVDAFSVHASAGLQAVKAAVDNKLTSKVLGVTVPTTVSDTECRAIYGKSALDQVLLFTILLAEAGVDGVICSPLEAKFIRRDHRFNHLKIVSPGIRPDWSSPAGQTRFATPAEAIRCGSDMLVIGKPITDPPESLDGDPLQAYEMIAEEIKDTLVVANFA